MDLIITEIIQPTITPIPIPTICLNMIVKNEAKIIIETLENLCKYFNFDYWVICDTGSSDQTKELICDFFLNKGIIGELLEHEWVDFAYNRSKALECAFNKTDYLLIFDADDRISGNFCLPPLLFNRDVYNLKIGKGFEWQRPLLMTNRKRWCFKGVAHEFLSPIDNMDKGSETIEGDYYIQPGTFGCRSQNPNKYSDDAIVLKNAFEKEMNDSVGGDKGLASRYAFYCAQSYKDSGNKIESIEWYKKVVLELDNWTQEKYYACLMLGNLYNSIGDNENAFRFWLKTIEFDPERIEGIVPAMEYLRSKGDHLLVNLLYHKFKNYNKNISVGASNKLFLDKTKYADYIEYNNSICAFYVDDKQSGYECCKEILKNKRIPPVLIQSTLSNINFYSEFLEKDDFKIILLQE